MSAWRRKALELLPQHRALIERAESPMSLWIDLHLRFRDHVASGERAVLQYASWCTREGAGTGPSDTLTAVLVAFYEDLAGEKELWPRFKDWFSPVAADSGHETNVRKRYPCKLPVGGRTLRRSGA